MYQHSNALVVNNCHGITFGIGYMGQWKFEILLMVLPLVLGTWDNGSLESF